MLIQFDLLEKGDEINEVTEVIKKVRKIQRTLLFSYGELTKIAKSERQKHIFDLLEEMTNENAFDGSFDVKMAHLMYEKCEPLELNFIEYFQ